MLSSLVEPGQTGIVPASLSGARVVLTGLRPPLGGALLSALARAGARLVAQAPGRVPAIDAVVSDLTRRGVEIALTKAPFLSAAAAVRYAQGAASACGGVDAVINMIGVSARDRRAAVATGDVEEAVHDLLLPASLVTRVGANRMRTTQREGAIVNILMDSPAAGREAAFAGYVRGALATMTRMEAREWAPAGIRVNAIVATAACASPAEVVARLTLHLLGRAGKQLSGHVLDASMADKHCFEEICAR